MTIYGLFSRTIFMALDRLPLFEKSQGMLSSGSLTVRSRLNPGTRLRQVQGFRLSSSVTRGGEYISATMAFGASQTPSDMRTSSSLAVAHPEARKPRKLDTKHRSTLARRGALLQGLRVLLDLA